MTDTRRPRLPTTTRYEFREPIGAGGAGTVYRAFDLETQQLVAIKVLTQKLSENLTLHRRLAVEFQAASMLEHPNIVRALECNNDGEVSYLVYELVEGSSLGVRIDQQGKLPEDEAIRIFTQLTQALQYAHVRQIIHRDVKPDNILLLPDGRAKLTDFGLAKDFNQSQDITRPASALGTPHFMAPEQFADAKNVSPRVDIYSLAATLYNALTGQIPFHAKVPVAILSNKEMMRLPTVRSIVPTINPQVDAAIFAALDPKPERRPATCLEFFKILTSRNPLDKLKGAPALTFDGQERRISTRYSLRVGGCALVDPNIHGGEEEKWPLVVRDVSVQGIGILLARRFEPGTELTVEGAAGPSGELERLPARVVRVEADRAGHWVHGCLFANPLADEQLKSLLKFA
jgi:eukaryotic-like serine/threonine-protein kinase